ncbi:MAG: hypothetical protein GY851_01405 [bacterium]|nr:hypothetical protein [bacterium]
MEDGIPDDLDIFWGMGDERLFRTHISAVLHTMVTGLRWRVDYGVPPPDTRAFNGVTDYHGHEVLLEALLAYLEKPAPFEHRVRAATYLDIAFEDFPKTAQDVHPRLATLLPKLKEEYGMTGGKQDAETDEWCLVDLVEKQIDNAARTVRYGTETGFLKPNG